MIRKRFWAVTALVFLLVTPACNLQQALPSRQAQTGQETAVPIVENTKPPTGLAGQQQPESTAKPQSPASPIRVTVTLEENQMARSDVNDQGGQLSTTSTTGVKYDLSIPSGALPGDFEIRMIPIEKMEGLPLSGGMLGGVQLEPEGTILSRPAILTITLPPGIPPDEVIPLAYAGTGERVHLTLAKLEGDRLTFQISHFSGYAGGQGNQAEADDLANTSTGNQGDDYEQQATNYWRKHYGQSDYDPQKAAEYFQTWYNTVIYPALKAAENNDAAVDAAGAAYHHWATQVSSAGLDKYLAAELKQGIESFLRGLANAYKQAYQRCMQMDAYQVGKMILRLAEIEQKNGLYGGTAPKGYTLKEKEPELQRCLTFKLEIDSLVTFKRDAGKSTYIIQVTGEIPLKLNTENWTYTGSGTLQMKSFTIEGLEAEKGEGYHCSYELGSMKSTTVDVTQATISIKAGQDGGSPTVKVMMFLKPGMLDCCSLKTNCWRYMSDGVSKIWSESGGPSAPYWSGAFILVHENLNQGEDGFLFTDFEPGSGQLFARLTDTGEASKMGVTATDALTLDLLHTPGQ